MTGFDPDAYLSEEFDPDSYLAEDTKLEDIPGLGGESIDYSQEQRQYTPQEAMTGAIETGLTMGTGATTGAIGYIKGAVEGLARRFIQEGFSAEDAMRMAQEEAAKYTYAPQTELGQEIVGEIGEAAEALPPVAGVAPSTQAAFRQGIKPSVDVGRAVASDVSQGAKGMLTPSQQLGKSVGAAETERALQRQMAAEQLPVPIKLTKGQATQDLPTQKFERETAKLEEGAPLRQKFDEQIRQIDQNIEAFIDETGTMTGDISKLETGQSIDLALTAKMNRDKKRIRDAYDLADKSDGAKEIVNLESVGRYLNENMASAEDGGIMYKLQKEAKRLGLAEGDFNEGSFNLFDMSVKDAEGLRKFINKNINDANKQDVRLGAGIKKAIDESVGDTGGEPYKRARKLRTRFANEFKNQKVINDLVSTKPGSSDRRVALEKVTDRIVTQGSNQDLINVRRTLFKEGESGKQAWKELQGQVLKDIKSKSTSASSTTADGTPILSPAAFGKSIKALDEAGKLEALYGKNGAAQLRDLAEVARDVYVSQPGAVNYSNTASTIAAALDLMTSAYAGYPLPITISIKKGSDLLKKQKVKKKVKESIEYKAGE